jgi:hypothetical protein
MESNIEYYKTIRKEYIKIRNIVAKELTTHYYKKYKKAVIVILLLCVSFTVYHITSVNEYISYFINKPNNSIRHDSTIVIHDSTKTFDKFLEKLAFIESSNNHTVVNKYGYMGKYQIGRDALSTIGLGSVPDKLFLSSPDLQDLAVKFLFLHNKNMLATYIGKYDNRVVGGIYITQSGILAAAHLGGSESVKKFLDTNGQYDFKDGNNTPISRYIKELGDYKLNL